MERKKQLEYCKICKNKGFDINVGIVCNLTGKPATFRDTCEDFSENTELNKYSRADEEDYKELNKLFRMFLGGRFIFTPLIIMVCMIMYFLTTRDSIFFLLPDEFSLLKYGANLKPITIHGDYWRLFTAILLHANLAHLLMNMYAFISIGFLLERQIGSLRMALSFIVCSFAASAVSVLWDDINMSVGASGAIFGMFGIYLILLTTDIMDKKTRLIILLSMAVYVIYNIVAGLKPGIDVGAHLGGLISGLIIGLFLRRSFSTKKRKHFNHVLYATSLVAVMSLVVLIMKEAPSPVNEYKSLMYEFSLEEHKALGVFDRSSYRNIETRSDLVRGNVMPRIRKCKRLATEAAAIEDLSDELKEDALLRIEYCNYSLRFFEMSLVINIMGKSDYSIVYDYIEEHRSKLAQKINLFDEANPFIPENPMDDFLSGFPEEVLLVVDGVQMPNREELSHLDFLELNASRFVDGKMTRKVYGPTYEYSILFETRKRSIDGLSLVRNDWKRKCLKKAYGL